MSKKEEAEKPKRNTMLEEARRAAASYLDDLAKDKKTSFKQRVKRLDGEAELVPRISSGSLKVDLIIGANQQGMGYPKGSIVEIYGPESSGKTTLALHAIANAQKEGKAVLFVDAEHTFDPSWAKMIGVDSEALLIEQPDTGEDALNLVDHATKSGKFGLIVVDSVAALVPRAELEGQIGDSFVGLQPRMMSQAMRKLNGHAKQTQTTIIFINQIREKIGVMFGSPETTPGGRALKFGASIRIDVRRISIEREGPIAISTTIRVKVVKNKTAPPHRETETRIIFTGDRGGIDVLGEVLDLAIDHGIIIKNGSWFSWVEETSINEETGEVKEKVQKIGQGRASVEEKFYAEEDFRDIIIERTKAAVIPGKAK